MPSSIYYTRLHITNTNICNTAVALLCSVTVYKLIDSMNDFQFDIKFSKRFFALGGSLLAGNIIYKLFTK